MPLVAPPSRPPGVVGNRARGRRHCPRPKRVVRRAARLARVRTALSAVGMAGVIGVLAIGGFWYMTVRVPALAAVAENERLAAERLLPSLDPAGPVVWQGRGGVRPVVMIDRAAPGGGRWMIRRD